MNAEKTRIYLIRHGETQYNVEGKFIGAADVPLNRRGMEQAKFLAKAFQGKEISIAYSSPLKRAMQTARLALGGADTAIEAEEGFLEINCGEWEGKTKEQAGERWEREVYLWAAAPHLLRIPNGETFKAVSDRAYESLQRIMRAASGKSLAVFSHMMVIQLLLMRLSHQPIEKFWEMPPLDNTSISLADVDIPNGNAEILLWGDISHIPVHERNKSVHIAGK